MKLCIYLLENMGDYIPGVQKKTFFKFSHVYYTPREKTFRSRTASFGRKVCFFSPE